MQYEFNPIQLFYNISQYINWHLFDITQCYTSKFYTYTDNYSLQTQKLKTF